MGIGRSDLERAADAGTSLSGRARTALQQHQRRVEVLQRELHGVDRMLAGAMTACDGRSQHEMLGAYLEAVQELRVSLQRLEGFLMQRLVRNGAGSEPALGNRRSLEYGVQPEPSASD
jgi:hypothetical protein